MKSLLRLSLLLAPLALCLEAQQVTGTPDWEIDKTLKPIGLYIERLLPILEQVRPDEWVAKGASDTYVTQWKSTVSQAKSVALAVQALGQHPDRLHDALEAMFRLQSLDSSLGSIEEGLRKYQNPALADLLKGVSSEDAGNRDKFRQYLLELASQKEEQLRVVDEEAQRCRGSLSRQPAPARRPK